jgi:hypothetical protein
VINVVIGEEAINRKDGEALVKYANIDKCWMCYHLVDTIENIKSENPCCSKFASEGKETELCSNHPVGECEKPLKMLMKAMFDGCVNATQSTTPQPLTCGNDDDYKKLEEPQEEAEKLLEEVLDNLPKEPTEDAADVLTFIETTLQHITTLTIIRTETVTNGVMIYYNDGTTTLQRNDGVTIITLTTMITITININGTATLVDSTRNVTVNMDSSISSINTATNT